MKRKWKKREISQPRSRIDLKKMNTAASRLDMDWSLIRSSIPLRRFHDSLWATMRRAQFNKVCVWIALALFTTPLAFAQDVKVNSGPKGMVWIPGGEFLMGAGT